MRSINGRVIYTVRVERLYAAVASIISILQVDRVRLKLREVQFRRTSVIRAICSNWQFKYSS